MQKVIDERSLTDSESAVFRALFGTVPPAVLSLPRQEIGESKGRGGMKIGIAAGKYAIPDNIDKMNDEIAEMFQI